MKLNQSFQFKKLKTSCLPSQLKIAKSNDEMKRIAELREAVFRSLYPELNDSCNDKHDESSLILYTENSQGKVISTARIVFDGKYGFPADEYAKQHIDERRERDLNMVEVSRFAISEEAKKLGLLSIYYQAFYELCVENDIYSMIIVVNDKSVKFHKRRIGAKILVNCIDNIAGSQFCFSCMEWIVKETLPKFKKWVGGDIEVADNIEETYPVAVWNTYSRFFASVYTHVQRELYQEAVKYLSGHVVDLGCGPARIAPLLAESENVLHYTGIEYADEMVEIAEYTLSQLSRPSFRVLHTAVEDVTGQFTSAVSLQNYYACINPIQMLFRVFDALEPGAIFVIATPNPSLDQQKLFQAAKNEMMWHPDFAAFEKYNMQLAENESAHFVSMDTLLTQLHAVGFIIEMCHQKHYEGGVNFVVCRKPNS